MMVRRIAALLVCGLLAPSIGWADQYPVPDASVAWTAGYALIVRRLCPRWDADYAALYAGGGLMTPDQPEWEPNGKAALAFWAGGELANEGFRSNPAFCIDPVDAAGPEADRVRPVIVPRQPPAGRN